MCPDDLFQKPDCLRIEPFVHALFADVHSELLAQVCRHVWQAGVCLAESREHKRVNKMGSRYFPVAFDEPALHGKFM